MIGSRIAEARKKRNLTQAQLAERLGVTQQAVQRYEKSVRDLKSSTLLDISNSLGVTISYLLGISDDPHAVTRWWDRNRARLGFDGVPLHSLRHAYLSELARRGVPPKTLQALAGHANISTTMDIYAHANLDDKRVATASVDW